LLASKAIHSEDIEYELRSYINAILVEFKWRKVHYKCHSQYYKICDIFNTYYSCISDAIIVAERYYFIDLITDERIPVGDINIRENDQFYESDEYEYLKTYDQDSRDFLYPRVDELLIQMNNELTKLKEHQRILVNKADYLIMKAEANAN